VPGTPILKDLHKGLASSFKTVIRMDIFYVSELARKWVV
jgi:hypothetical protein